MFIDFILYLSILKKIFQNKKKKNDTYLFFQWKNLIENIMQKYKPRRKERKKRFVELLCLLFKFYELGLHGSSREEKYVLFFDNFKGMGLAPDKSSFGI